MPVPDLPNVALTDEKVACVTRKLGGQKGDGRKENFIQMGAYAWL